MFEHFDLALVLVVLTVVSGFFVALNRFWYQPRIEREEISVSPMMYTVIDYSRSFFPVLLLVLVIRSFVFEPFRIPSGSMMPTLIQGDFIFVQKYRYGLRLPVFETKILDTGSPQRGDVVVFRLPKNPKIHYIKRVVGLPGDEIVYQRPRLFVNGELVATVPDEAQPVFRSIPRFIESLGERSHSILLKRRMPGGQPKQWTVEEGHYFMMGDNRDDSQDSRVIGQVPDRYLVGRATAIWLHMDGLEWPDWGRMGTSIE